MRQTNRWRCENFNSRTHVECDCIYCVCSCVMIISTHALTWSATCTGIVRLRQHKISTHALTWSATHALLNHNLRNIISTHALTWSATNSCQLQQITWAFQLTHSRGVRQFLIYAFQSMQKYFNSRTHVECDGTLYGDQYKDLYFNSRTHVECDTNISLNKLSSCISTHALTWSATKLCTHMAKTATISTHALTWSATIGIAVICNNTSISTHALTWSATLCDFVESVIKSDFNSRTHVECDALTEAKTLLQCDFNSRTHVECDMLNYQAEIANYISTHALTWSATFHHIKGFIWIAYFNSRTHVECDEYLGIYTSIKDISTHALTWSATDSFYAIGGDCGFQLTHSRGVRPQPERRHCLCRNFNSRTHVECDFSISMT